MFLTEGGVAGSLGESPAVGIHSRYVGALQQEVVTIIHGPRVRRWPRIGCFTLPFSSHLPGKLPSVFERDASGLLAVRRLDRSDYLKQYRGIWRGKLKSGFTREDITS